MPLFGSNVHAFKGQKYDDLKKQCQTSGNLFVDPEFPAQDKSLFYTSGKVAGVVWKRPKQICDNPKLFVAGTSSGDVTQGRLGNCWFVAASSCLALYKELIDRVIPSDQEWEENKPDLGIFHFQFWRYGQWVDVVVDDQLPTVNDELIFIHSQSKNEFWSALLEKAYAKIVMSIRRIWFCMQHKHVHCFLGCTYNDDLVAEGGYLVHTRRWMEEIWGEALEDFTGGVSEMMSLVELGVADKPEERATLFARLQKEVERKSLLAASIPAESSSEMEASTDMGLVKGHAYGVTAVKSISLESGILSYFSSSAKIPMVRLRNPWGQGEWKGRFSDDDPEWQKIPKSEREKVGIVFEEDGEFWMHFDDFCQHFINVSYCRMVNTSVFSLSKTWHEGLAHSAWNTKAKTAGGCLNNKATFLQNPQFLFTIYDDEEACLMQIMQKSVRSQAGSGNVTIGFTLFKVEENRMYRIHDHSYFENVKNTVFRDSRSIFQKIKLDKGRYLILACTFEPNVEQEFIFRLYTGAANDFKEAKHDVPQPSFWSCCAKKPVMITHIKILKADGLEKQERGGADPYCIIKCEKQSVYTTVKHDTISPEWNQSAVFYRKNPMKYPIKIQIWNKNVLKDSYLGKHLFMSADECTRRVETVSLIGRGKENQARPGTLLVEITQLKDLTGL